MKMRLAFGVATAFHPDILIATGDAHFVAKARERSCGMIDLSSLFSLATHSVATVKTLRSRVILMELSRW